MKTDYQYISADSHLEVPPDRWRQRVPEAHRDRAPRLIQLPDGSDAWAVEGQPLYRGGANLTSGPVEDRDPGRMKYEGSPGTGTPEQRLGDQDLDGVDAEVLFTGVGGRRMWNSIADDDAYLAVVQAYNNFLGEEYCPAAPDRLIGLGIMPERGVDQAVAEMERCAKLGLKGVNLGRFPSGYLYPTREDDKFWAAAVDMDIPVTIHTSFQDDEGGGGRAARAARPTDPGIAVARRCSAYAIRGAPNAILMVMTGLFERFPRLRIYIAENQVGWLPNCFDQTDVLYLRHYPYQAKHGGFKPLDRLPSEYLKEHFLWGFMDNPVGVQLRHYVGVDKLLWGSDMPHAPSDWPYSMATLDRNFRGVPDHEKHLMVAGNTVDFFHLDETFESTPERDQRVAERRQEVLKQAATQGAASPN